MRSDYAGKPPGVARMEPQALEAAGPCGPSVQGVAKPCHLCVCSPKDRYREIVGKMFLGN